MAPLYKKALIIGATSGIGQALAVKLLSEGTSVIVTGRRTERLSAFVSEHQTQDNSLAFASAYTLDITRLASIRALASPLLATHPDLDCVVLNSGIQRAFDFSRPSAVDLDAFAEELTTNYLAFVHLVAAFLPHLQTLAAESGKTTHLVFVSSNLALAPTLVRAPGYNASKAAVHSFVMNLRTQLRDNGDRGLRVVEVVAPPVQTELHDSRHQPDLVNGGEIGMPLAAFVEKMYEGLVRGGKDQFAIGGAEPWLAEGGFEAERQKVYEQQVPVVKGFLAKHVKQ